ncbi:hypothetical protein IH980_01700 [Patescibacteria group bacterium]|nr:hypothetical protein [Patescibacteria group bacterium]
MLAATHAITGAVIAKLAPTPSLGYAAALLSHPILDSIPHWDMMTRHSKRSRDRVITFSLLDAITGFGLGFVVAQGSVPPLQLLLTMVVAQLPDWLEAPYVVFGWKFPPFSWVKAFQHHVHRKLPFPDGLFTQLILIFLLLLITR